MITALEKFAKYHCIWEKDRDEDLEIFLKDDPKLSEFEQKIRYYEELEMEIAAESEYYDVGPIALYTGEYFAFKVFKSRKILKHQKTPPV